MNPINTGLLVTNERNWRAQNGQGKSKQAKYLGPSSTAPVERNAGTHPPRVVTSSSKQQSSTSTDTTSRNIKKTTTKEPENTLENTEIEKKKNVKCQIL